MCLYVQWRALTKAALPLKAGEKTSHPGVAKAGYWVMSVTEPSSITEVDVGDCLWQLESALL